MEKIIRKLGVLFASVVVCSMLAGCGSWEDATSIHEDGSVYSKITVKVDSGVNGLYPGANKDAKNFLAEMQKKAEEDEYQVSKIDNGMGFLAERDYHSLQQIVDEKSKMKLWNPDEHYGGVRLRHGLFYDTVSIDGPYFGKNDLKGYQEAAKIDYNPRNAQDTAIVHDYMGLLNKGSGTFVLELPTAAIYSNADDVKAEGKLLTWDLKKRLSRSSDQVNAPIRVKFVIYHQTRIYAIVGVGVILLLLAGTAVYLGVKKKDESPLGKFNYPIAALLVVIVLVGGIATKYHIAHPPILSNSDRVCSDQAKSADGGSLKERIGKINATPLSSLNEIAAVLREKGVQGKVTAASDYDEAGFLALVDEGKNGKYVAIYDAKDDVIAFTPHLYREYPLLTFGEQYYSTAKGDKKMYNPLMVTITIPSDNQVSADRKLGRWNKDGSHDIPLYCLFEVGQSGDFVLKNVYSAGGLNPKHYHEDVKESRNKELANIIVTHADRLNIDIEKRDIHF